MKKILKQIALLYIIFYTVVFILFASNVFNSSVFISTFYSGSINLMNIIISIIAFNYGFNQPNKKFMIYVLGSMVGRMFLVLIMVFFVLKFANINQYGFIFSLFIVYFVALVFEINFYRLKIKEKKI